MDQSSVAETAGRPIAFCASSGAAPDFCIESSMRVRRSWRTVVLLLGTALLLHAGTPGSFRGSIVDGPSAAKGWIYVQGRNGMARRVNIAHARVAYDEEVPATERRPKAEDGLVVGTEVRVTAEQGSDGEWKASEVEILKVEGGEHAAGGVGKS
jgi:hypothetical protein